MFRIHFREHCSGGLPNRRRIGEAVNCGDQRCHQFRRTPEASVSTKPLLEKLHPLCGIFAPNGDEPLRFEPGYLRLYWIQIAVRLQVAEDFLRLARVEVPLDQIFRIGNEEVDSAEKNDDDGPHHRPWKHASCGLSTHRGVLSNLQ